MFFSRSVSAAVIGSLTEDETSAAEVSTSAAYGDIDDLQHPGPQQRINCQYVACQRRSALFDNMLKRNIEVYPSISALESIDFCIL